MVSGDESGLRGTDGTGGQEGLASAGFKPLSREAAKDGAEDASDHSHRANGPSTGVQRR